MLHSPNTKVQNILKVADVLEQLPEPDNFNMQYFQWPSMGGNSHLCGTPACIAGYTCAVLGVKVDGPETQHFAAELFALNPVQSAELFYPSIDDLSYHVHAARFNINNIQAAQLLRHLATTGSVDWSILGEAYA